MILCIICNKEWQDRRVFGYHLTRSHRKTFDTELDKEKFLTHTLFGENVVTKVVQDYINEKYCVFDLPIDIAKLLSLMGVQRTSKQERATERYKQRYIKGLQTKYGTGVTNISQVKEIQQKKERTYANRCGSYDEYLKLQRTNMLRGYNNYVGTTKHKETLDKCKQTVLHRYGHINFGQGEEAKQKAAKSRKDLVRSWDYEERLARTSAARAAVNHRGGFSSKPEKRIRKILIDLNVESIYNHHMWHYNWDLVTDKNIIIEVQGTMWHAKPSLYKEDDLIMGKILAKDIWEKDRRKRAKATAEGYKVIEIWEDEINSRNDEALLALVKERLQENGYEFYDR